MGNCLHACEDTRGPIYVEIIRSIRQPRTLDANTATEGDISN
jgi:hypothetical protein